MILYTITNRLNGKRYVGITRGTLARRWRGHRCEAKKGTQTALYAAIRKYGVDAFEIRHVATAEDLEHLIALERHMIASLNTKAPHGYNLTDGGDGTRGMDPATRARIAEKCRGRSHTVEARERIGAASRGRKLSESTRRLIGDAHRGRKLSDEHRQKMAKAKIGRKLPPRSREHSDKISAGLRRAWQRRKAETSHDASLL